MASEYIFFDAALRDRFVVFVADLGIVGKVRRDDMDGYVVELPDGLEADTEDEIEAQYDVLMDEQRDLVDSTDDDNAQDVMGVTVTLPNGESRVVRLPAHHARRLFEHFTSSEIHELVSTILDSALNPVDGSLCSCAPTSR